LLNSNLVVFLYLTESLDDVSLKGGRNNQSQFTTRTQPKQVQTPRPKGYGRARRHGVALPLLCLTRLEFVKVHGLKWFMCLGKIKARSLGLD